MGWHCDSCPGTGGGERERERGEGDEGAVSRKGEEAYAGGGGTGPLVAMPSTLFEPGGGESSIVCESLRLTRREDVYMS